MSRRVWRRVCLCAGLSVDSLRDREGEIGVGESVGSKSAIIRHTIMEQTVRNQQTWRESAVECRYKSNNCRTQPEKQHGVWNTVTFCFLLFPSSTQTPPACSIMAAPSLPRSPASTQCCLSIFSSRPSKESILVLIWESSRLMVRSWSFFTVSTQKKTTE